MNAVGNFIKNIFDLNVLVLFLISSFFLIFVDCKEYKKTGLHKEYKFSKFMGYFYAAAGILLYITAAYIM